MTDDCGVDGHFPENDWPVPLVNTPTVVVEHSLNWSFSPCPGKSLNRKKWSKYACMIIKLVKDEHNHVQVSTDGID